MIICKRSSKEDNASFFFFFSSWIFKKHVNAEIENICLIYISVCVSDDRNVSLAEIKLLTKGGGGQDWKGLAEASSKHIQ